jgi:phytol kinase
MNAKHPGTFNVPGCLHLSCIMDSYMTFFVKNFPTFREFVLGFPPFLLWAYGSLFLAGYVKRNKGLKTGYTRKIFHFLIFTSAAAIQTAWGLRPLCLFGIATSAVIFYAVLRGDGHFLYEALAREKDAPHRTHYILVPYFATLIGGITSNALFGDVALVGYLITGLGDAIGEPVGTRFGKHPYRVPAFRGIPATRSYEGSAAVFLVSLLAIILAFSLSPELSFEGHSLFLIPGLALLSAILEAISPHGWDNAVMQIVPSWCATLFL